MSGHFFCSSGVDLKGQGQSSKGHTVWKSDLACILKTIRRIEISFGMVMLNHESKIFCSLSVHLKGQGHRSKVRLVEQSCDQNPRKSYSQSTIFTFE